jgi:hypothetical protein
VLVARAHTPATPWAALLDDLRSALISVRADLDGGRRQGTRPRTRKTDGGAAPRSDGDAAQ